MDPEDIDYALWSTVRVIEASREELSRSRAGLSDALTTEKETRKQLGSLLEQNGLLQEEIRSTKHDLVEAQTDRLALEATLAYYVQAKETSEQNEKMLQFQLEQTQSEVLEYQSRLRKISEPTRSITCHGQDGAATAEIKTVRLCSALADKVLEIYDLERTADLLKSKVWSLENSGKASSVSTNYMSKDQQSNSTQTYPEPLSEEAGSAILKQVNELSASNSHLRAIEKGHMEEIKSLQRQSATQKDELVLIKRLLKQKFPNLCSDLSNLHSILGSSRRNAKRKCRSVGDKQASY